MSLSNTTESYLTYAYMYINAKEQEKEKKEREVTIHHKSWQFYNRERWKVPPYLRLQEYDFSLPGKHCNKIILNHLVIKWQ